MPKNSVGDQSPASNPGSARTRLRRKAGKGRSTPFSAGQDGLLAKEDEELPLARHVVSGLQHFHFVKDIIMASGRSGWREA